MTSAAKRSYPFGSRPSSLVEDTHQFKVPQAPSHKKMSMTPPSINVSIDSSASSWKLSNRTTMTATFTKQDNSNLTTTAYNDTDQDDSPSEKSPLPSPPSSKGRRNMKNLQLVVPPVRSSISAPSSPQLPPNSTTHTHNRRPSTPICVYQNKSLLNSNVADPMALMSKTENAIGEDLPYKDEPIQILPNLYLGSELNAANRSMLNGINVEFILNVGKEVENPYLEEITNANSSHLIDFFQVSPSLPTTSSASSEDSYSTAIQSPLSSSMQLDSPTIPPSPFGVLRSNSSFQKRASVPTRSSSMSLQSAHGAMLSGVPLIVPATSEFKPLKYKKLFWTHNQENLIADFMSAFAFIDEARSAGRNILVHCQCGVSRSASLIIGYVMKANKMTLNQAYEFVKDRSPYISPNMSLVYQLVEFEKTLKLGNNSNNSNSNSNNALPSTPTHGKGDLKRTHSRSSSIESELLLIGHRRSNSLSRGNLSNNNDSPPKTPLLVPEGLLSIPQQQNQQRQTTVKGGTGRFHVITASIAPVSPSSLSPASSVSPTSTGSPTTPSSETSSPTTKCSRRFSRPPPPLSSKKSNSTLATSKSSSQSPRSSIDRTPLSPKEVINTPISPKVISSPKAAITNTNNSTSNDADPFSSFDNFDSSQTSNISFHSYDAHIVNQRGHEVLSGPNSGIFSKSTLDSIFSPTRVSPPVTPITIPDLFADNE